MGRDKEKNNISKQFLLRKIKRYLEVFIKKTKITKHGREKWHLPGMIHLCAQLQAMGSAPFNLSLIHKMDYQYIIQGNKSETMYEKFVDWFRLLTFHTLFNKNWVSQFYWRRKSGKTTDLWQVSHGNNVHSTYKLIEVKQGI